MGPETFNLRQLERRVYRSVDELVDDCFPLLHRESLERVVAGAFGAGGRLGLDELKVELVHQNFARLSGVYRGEAGDMPVVIEGLWAFSPRTWAFRLDVVHMRAEVPDPALAVQVVSEVLARWKTLAQLGSFKYRKGVFFLTLDPLSERAVS